MEVFVDEMPFRAFWRTRVGGAEGAGGTDGEEKPKKLARDISTMIHTKAVWQFTGSSQAVCRSVHGHGLGFVEGEYEFLNGT